MKRKIIFLALLSSFFFLTGCLEDLHHNDAALTSALETVNALAVANVASSPINPYAYPIGVGLAGLVGIVEALRRKEKSGRKYAEGKLNGNNSSS